MRANDPIWTLPHRSDCAAFDNQAEEAASFDVSTFKHSSI
jgi:hypothetical protein